MKHNIYIAIAVATIIIVGVYAYAEVIPISGIPTLTIGPVASIDDAPVLASDVENCCDTAFSRLDGCLGHASHRHSAVAGSVYWMLYQRARRLKLSHNVELTIKKTASVYMRSMARSRLRKDLSQELLNDENVRNYINSRFLGDRDWLSELGKELLSTFGALDALTLSRQMHSRKSCKY